MVKNLNNLRLIINGNSFCFGNLENLQCAHIIAFKAFTFRELIGLDIKKYIFLAKELFFNMTCFIQIVFELCYSF